MPQYFFSTENEVSLILFNQTHSRIHGENIKHYQSFFHIDFKTSGHVFEHRILQGNKW